MVEIKITEPPVCSHCGATMAKYAQPPVSFGDGLGWPTPFLWICANDECPVFKKGFYQTFQRYGQTSTMRVIVEPDTGREAVIPAFTNDKEHIDAFAATRKHYLENVREEDLPVGADDDDDKEWPDVNYYNPDYKD